MSEEKMLPCTNCGHENKDSATFCSNCGAAVQHATTGNEEEIDQEEKDKDPFIGRQVGRCILQKQIGVGGSGAVYKGMHAGMGKLFAIKVMHADLVTDEESKLRFEREVKVLAGVQHENIVSITDSGYVPGIGPYMEMEWLEGSTLFEERKNRGFLEFDEVIWVVDQMTDALSFMHHKGIVHRDLKPENMMLVYRASQRVAEQGEESLVGRLLKIFDFGIALLLEDNRKLTAAGMVVGTPHYMAPEQIIVDAPVDHRADLYAAGAITYELLCGQPPFWGAKKPVQVMERHLRRPPPEIKDIAPQREFPPGLQEVLNRALAKNPAERYQDARELFDAVKAVLEPASGVNFADERTVVGGGAVMWEELQAARAAVQAQPPSGDAFVSAHQTVPEGLPSPPRQQPVQPTAPGLAPHNPMAPMHPQQPHYHNPNPMQPNMMGQGMPPAGGALPFPNQPFPNFPNQMPPAHGVSNDMHDPFVDGEKTTVNQMHIGQTKESRVSRSMLFTVLGLGLGMFAILLFYVLYRWLRP